MVTSGFQVEMDADAAQFTVDFIVAIVEFWVGFDSL